MGRFGTIALAAALLAAVGVVEGLRSNRWGASDDLLAASARLDAVPRAVGDWTGTDTFIEPKLIQVAEATGHVCRHYRNAKTGDAVDVLMLCGPPGPLGAHTPDICYSGIGYQQDGRIGREAVKYPGGESTYFSTRFVRPGSAEPPLQVCWAWGVDGQWQATDAPRRDFALRGALYKFYVSRRAAGTGGTGTADPVQTFLTAFLPEVKAALAPPAD